MGSRLENKFIQRLSLENVEVISFCEVFHSPTVYGVLWFLLNQVNAF
jgi:hypothetical protein